MVDDTHKTIPTKHSSVLVKLFFVAAGTGILLGAWDELQESNWMYHDQMATVQGKGWQVGEYKSCVTVTREELKYRLLLDCDESWEHDPKIFDVRFWGPVPSKDALQNWKCRKNEGSDPAITCEKETH